jgi:hypothetical protein
VNYMGSTDDDKRAWMLNFVAKLQAAEATYMVTGPDVTAISGAVDSFVAALTIVQQPDGRNKGTTANKNDALAAAVAICRQYARLIKYNAGISDQAKIDAGIKPPNSSSQPRPCPVSAPIISVIAATNGAQTLTYADSLDSDVRRKPEGADGIVLFRAVGTAPATNIDQAQFYRKYTTKPMPVFFDGEDNGKIATYYARWIGQRGDMSTPSAAVSMAIAA